MSIEAIKNKMASWRLQQDQSIQKLQQTIEALRQAIEQAEKRNCDNCESLRLAALGRIEELVTDGVEAEREACAKVCDALAAQDKLSNYYAVAARAIRARGEA